MFKKLNIKNSFKIKNLKLKIRLLLFILVLLITFSPVLSKNARADSSYVLPYPSAMPGSIFYKLNLAKEWVQRFWYFGDFGQFKYNLKQADKYLVEAKTLFDYKQYFLAHRALQKSDMYFEKIYPNLLSAKKNGKNISVKETMLKDAAQKHIEELTKLKSSVPSVFDWTPERESPTTLNLWESIDTSIRIRNRSDSRIPLEMLDKRFDALSSPPNGPA